MCCARMVVSVCSVPASAKSVSTRVGKTLFGTNCVLSAHYHRLSKYRDRPAVRFSIMSWVMDDPGIILPHLTPQAIIGISVSIAGNVLISLALNLQKLAHLRLELARDSLSDTERESRQPECDLNARHVTRSDTAARLGPAEHALEDGEHIETQPLIPHRSSGQPSTSTYGLSQYTVPVPMDARSRKSSSSSRPTRHPRKPSFASKFLPPPLKFGVGPSDPFNSRVDRSGRSALPVEDVFTQGPTRIKPQGKGKISSQNTDMKEDRKESDYLRSKLWLVSHALFWRPF